MYIPNKKSNTSRFCHAYYVKGLGGGLPEFWVESCPVKYNKDGTFTLLSATPITGMLAEITTKAKRGDSTDMLITAKDAVIPVGHWLVKDSEGRVYGISETVFKEYWKYKFWVECIRDGHCSVEDTGRDQEIYERMPKGNDLKLF